MKNIKRYSVLLFVLSCVLLLVFSNRTFTSFESTVDDDINLNIADWKILVDNQDVAKQKKAISLKNIVWSSEHTRENKVAPGSTGVVNVKIDPTLTEVAFSYNISYVDHNMDPNVLLTVTSITLDGKSLEDENENTFSGIISLDDIKKGKTMSLVIHVEWVNDEDNNETDSLIGFNESEANYLELNLEATQYKGE